MLICKKTKPMLGFSLVELMITIAIIAIISVIAIPSYLNYSKKAYYAEIVQAAAPYKLGVINCANVTGDLTACNGGDFGVPANRLTAIGGVETVVVDEGTITVTPVAGNGIEVTDTYVLTPSDPQSNGVLLWTVSGGGLDNGLVP